MKQKKDSGHGWLNSQWQVKPLNYSQNGVYGTPEFSFPFKFLGGFSGLKSEMVQLEGEQLNFLIHALEEWERHLAQLDSKSLRCADVKLIP
jgi:hypothetical protein